MSRESFDAEARRLGAHEADTGRAEQVVSLMRLAALLGPRNGHTGIFPLGKHPRPLHVYPFRTYEVDDGLFVVAAADAGLVGAELLAIDGTPVDVVCGAVAPLVPRDNDWTVRARRPAYLMTAEVLRGLGVVADAKAAFAFRRPDGGRFEVELAPVPARRADFDTGFRLPRRPGVRYLERRDEQCWVETVPGSDTLQVAYNATGESESLAREVEAAARGAGALVLDLRHNGGGDNRTYAPLLAALERLSAMIPLFVLISRVTFSAAMQLVVDLEQRTDATFVGEPTGGSPNHFGDAVAVELPGAGLVARVATLRWQTAGADDVRAARAPDVPVTLSSGDLFSDRDRVLAAARPGG